MGQNWAIAIGINDYYNLQPLNYSKQDAESVRDFFLDEAGFEQVYFFSEDAPPIESPRGPMRSLPSYANLKRFLRERFQVPFLRPGDNFWFFFAGHGELHEGHDYLMPLDADPGDVDDTALRLNDITDLLRNCGADNVVMVLDACRSQGKRKGVGVGAERQQGVVTVYSCSPREASYEIEDLGHGSFTYSLLEGLRLQGNSNCATVERLDRYLRYQVPELNQRYSKPRQTPYTAVEPVGKKHLILLPQEATLSADVQVLKLNAFEAESTGELLLAKQLWTRVLAVSPGDHPQAIAAIERIARMPETAPQSPMEQQPDLQALSFHRSPTHTTAPLLEVTDVVDSIESLDEVSGPVTSVEPEQSPPKEASKTDRPSTPPIAKPIAAPSESQERDIQESKTPTHPLQPAANEKKESSGSLSSVGGGLEREDRKPLLSDPVTRRRALQLGGFTIAGIAATLLGRKFLSSYGSLPPASAASFNFEVVTVNAQGEIADRKPKSVEGLTQELASGVNLEMVSIPRGNFTMGSPETEEGRYENEGPQRQVTIAPFMMGRFQVTQAQYLAVMGRNPSRFTNEGDHRPVETVTWHDTRRFCERLSKATGREYRLPSEAEWEYACRAGTTTPFHFGETITTEVANYNGNSYGSGPKGAHRQKTTPVGSFGAANAFGLYDMHGNVWEWCEDVWHGSYAGAPPGGTPWIEGGSSNQRVLRGGSWGNYPWDCRSANRNGFSPAYWDYLNGFRVVCSSA